MGSIWSGLRQQIFLGSEAFVERMQDRIKIEGDELSIPMVQRRAAPQSLESIAKSHLRRNDAIVAAYATGAFSYREIGEFFGVHLATVGCIIRQAMLQDENWPRFARDNPLGRHGDLLFHGGEASADLGAYLGEMSKDHAQQGRDGHQQDQHQNFGGHGS